MEEKEIQQKEKQEEEEILSYRLECTRTANGLSHFVMYGDVPEEESPL